MRLNPAAIWGMSGKHMEGMMISLKEHITMGTVGAIMGAAVGAGIGGSLFGPVGAVAVAVLGGIGGVFIGSFM
jgi:hypothetical protein